MGAASNLRSVSEQANQLVAEQGLSFSEAVGKILQAIPEKPRHGEQTEQQTEAQTEQQTEQPRKRR